MWRVVPGRQPEQLACIAVGVGERNTRDKAVINLYKSRGGRKCPRGNLVGTKG